MTDNSALTQIQSLWNQFLDEASNETNNELPSPRDPKERTLTLRPLPSTMGSNQSSPKERKFTLLLNQVAIGMLLNLFRAEYDERERQPTLAIHLLNVSFENEIAVDQFVRFMDAAQLESICIYSDQLCLSSTWLLDRLWKLNSLRSVDFEYKSLLVEAGNFAALSVQNMLAHRRTSIRNIRLRRYSWNIGLVVGLQNHASGLQSLSLQECIRTSTQFGMLVSSLVAVNKKMKHSIVSLDLSHNKHIGGNSLPDLVRILKYCMKLQVLNVSGCAFFGGVQASNVHNVNFIETLKRNNTLLSLDVSSCGISRKDLARDLFGVLETNPTLKHLSVNGFNAVPFLIESLPKMSGITTLSSVRLSGGASLLPSFLDALHQNTSLCHLRTHRRNAHYADHQIDVILDRNFNLRKLPQLLERRERVTLSTWPLCVEHLMTVKASANNYEKSKHDTSQTGMKVDMSAVYGFLLATSNDVVSWL